MDKSIKNGNGAKGAGKKVVGYVLGSITTFAVACVAVPIVMTKVIGLLYKTAITTVKSDNDDWGPVIEKKDKERE